MKRWLAPVLIPSWRFFDRIGTGIRLEYAWVPHPLADHLGAWREYRPRPARVPGLRALGHIFLNAAGNERLYVYGRAEKVLTEESARAVNDIQERIHDYDPPPPKRPFLIFRLTDREDDDLLFVSEARRFDKETS
ncbi:MAG: hypothetical protein KF767_01015 [Bdellovibrionaceae bacterium]|nr:hypothetical protein [Pseudobdellovibrionaceae bacterium]